MRDKVKIGGAVAAIGLGLGLVLWNQLGTDKVRLASSTMLVDVTSGQLYKMSLSGKNPFIPERVPGTDREVLFPVYEEDGSWKVDPLHLPTLAELKVGNPEIVATDGTVRVSSESPKSFTKN
jgi:hypothetical protein